MNPELWKPHTEFDEMRADGYLTNGTKTDELDITSLSDTESVTTIEAAASATEWEAGRVYASEGETHGVRSLIVPKKLLTEDLVKEALLRYPREKV